MFWCVCQTVYLSRWLFWTVGYSRNNSRLGTKDMVMFVQSPVPNVNYGEVRFALSMIRICGHVLAGVSPCILLGRHTSGVPHEESAMCGKSE